MKLSKSNAPSMTTELEELAAKLNIVVRYAAFRKGDFAVRSGACTVRGQSFIIIDRKLSPLDRAEVLLTQLTKYSLESYFLSPRLRSLVESVQPLQPA